MSSNLKVNTILPSTGTTIGIGTVGGLINVVGNIDVNSTSGISTFNGLEISGIVTAKAGAAVTYYGDGSNLTNLPAQATIANNADNRVITGGSGVNLNAEANLKFDGTNLDIDSDSGHLRIGDDQDLDLYHNGSNGYLKNSTGQQLYRSGTHTFENAAGSTEYLRIGSNGYVNIGTGSAEQQLTVQNSGQHSLIRVIGNASSDTGVDFGDPADSDIGRIRYSNNGDYMTFRVNNINAVRFDSSGRVQIGGGNTPAQVGDGSLIVYSTDRLHPAIKPAGMSNNYANGWTLLGDNYQADESQVNLGVSYSSSGLVLSRGVKVSGSADDVYLSSQDSYSTRPSAIKLDYLGAFNFLTTETNATVATDSAVSLTEVFKIDRVGNIYQKISGRNLYLGASNQLRIGVQSNGDPNIEAVAGNLKIMDSGSTIMQLRDDGFEMKQDIYFGTAGKGIVLGNTSNVDANTLDDYEEGSWTPALQNGSGSFHVHSAVYTKIGRQVGIQFYLTLSNAGSNTNQVQITGLPFPVRAGGWTASKVSTGYNNSGIHCRAEQSTSRIDIKGPADGAVTFANINGTWILSSFIYFTDS